MSLPLWECGLKSKGQGRNGSSPLVTPLVGVWIEIHTMYLGFPCFFVTPLVGVWIEIMYLAAATACT